MNRNTIYAAFKVRPIETLPQKFQDLSKEFPQIIKAQSFNYEKQKQVNGFNQEILVYSSNTTTPLKTASVQQNDQFSFNEQILTPQPNRTFDFQITKRTPAFCYSRASRFNRLDQQLWFYVDDAHKIQGPFNSLLMDAWYCRGAFEDYLRIGFKYDNSEHFLRIYQIKQEKLSSKEAHLVRQLIRRQSCPNVITESLDQQLMKQTLPQQQQQDEDVVKVLQLPPLIIKRKQSKK